ncbi:hypothetical protein AVEN_215882-1 [Araneus ventricosus]|uniref:RNase H type-1 domain-containing protein n=1 Tax=Araneus ventricosus TaxID=182803 RepID=A0A4Y2HGP5_ARAVE|nr:hypothetical protein AVEN_215882-1 [Araneus ventricosus]
MQLQFEARFTSIYRLRISLPPNITDTQPQDLEIKTTGWSIHNSELKPNQISLEDGEANIARRDIINIFTDGLKTEHGVGAAFCVLTNDIWTYQWSAKLNDNNVFQAELTTLHEAVIYASHLPNHNTFKIHVDNRASIMASSNSKSTNQTTRQIFKILLINPRIKVSWVKEHAVNIGNERADQLVKDATQPGQPHSLTKLPKPHIKGLLRKRSGKPHGRMAIQTGKFITSWPKLVSVPLLGLERMLSSSLNMALSLPTSKGFTCLTAIIAVVVELARHFTMLRMLCIYTVSWHMRKPVPNFEQEWLKRVANNIVFRHKIRRTVKFISENRDLFRPP